MSISILKQLGAAAVLTAISCAPAPAQLVISEPCYCAQFYPNANCQNKEQKPNTDPNYRLYGGQSSGPWPSSEASASRQSGPADAIRPTRPLIFAAFVASPADHRIQRRRSSSRTAALD